VGGARSSSNACGVQPRAAVSHPHPFRKLCVQAARQFSRLHTDSERVMWAAQQGLAQVIRQYANEESLSARTRFFHSVDARWYSATPLWMAVHAQHLEACEALLACGADVHAPAHLENASDAHRHPTPLWLACRLGYEPIVELLLRSGATVQHNGFADRFDMSDSYLPVSALLVAARFGHARIIELLAQHDMQEGQRRLDYDTALNVAGFYMYVPAVHTLLRLGAQPSPHLLEHAAQKLNLELTALLAHNLRGHLTASNHLHHLFRYWAFHPSTMVPEQRKRAALVAQCLLNAGAVLPLTLIGIAASIGADMLRLYIDRSDWQQQLSQRHKETALLGAVGYERRANVQLLLEAGVAPNVWPFTQNDLTTICPFYRGRIFAYTPPSLLHLAVCTRNRAVVELLVHHGAYLDVCDALQHTPESLARSICGGVDGVVKCLAAARKEAAAAAARLSVVGTTTDAGEELASADPEEGSSARYSASSSSESPPSSSAADTPPSSLSDSGRSLVSVRLWDT